MPRLTPLSYRKLVAVFQSDGWQHSRTKGDHLVYVKRGAIRPLVIPMYEEVPVFVIKNLLRTAQMTRERFFDLLKLI